MTGFIAFLIFWAQPLAMASIMAFLLWYIHMTAKAEIRYENQPEVIKARQKADYDRAHAYTEGKCPESD